ncbi:MAG: class I SAM-dependent methyltransferase [Calditrichaeota bacterium]|nr:class I SAM-dependent methyltransferase [Calditrichota bacterium]
MTDASHSDLDRLRAEYADRDRRLAGSDIYSLFNPAHLFMTQQRQRVTLKTLRRFGFYPLDRYRILEIGCGRGGVLLEYLGFGATPAHVHGIDLLEDRVAEAHARMPSLALSCADGQHLPYRDCSFDLVMQYTAFSSILDDTVKTNIAREMLRVLRPDGAIIWYDYWLNPTNRQAHGIRPAEIRRLFPGCEYRFQRITLAPPVTRKLIVLSWIICAILEKIVFLNTHYFAIIRRISSPGISGRS